MKKLFFFGLFSLSLPLWGVAQFNYIGGGFGFGKTNIAKHTNHQAFFFELNAMTRPLRNFGIGVSLGLPVSQGSNYRSGISYELGFRPQQEDYTFRAGSRASLILRLFLGDRVNWYFDVRMNAMSFEENYIFNRAEIPWDYYYNFAGAPSVDFRYNATHSLIYPGFHFGHIIHAKDHLSINFSIGMDMMSFSGPGFVHFVPHGRTSSMDDTRNSLVMGELLGTKTTIASNFGISYYF